MILYRQWCRTFRTLSLVRGQAYSIHPLVSFQAERTAMSSNNWKIERLKYCRIKKVNGELKYYAVVQGKLVEVDKEVCIRRIKLNSAAAEVEQCRR